MQCHLEGKAAIERPGRHVYEFRPGDSLSDYVRYFLLIDATGSGLGAVSQVEALRKASARRNRATPCLAPAATTRISRPSQRTGWRSIVASAWPVTARLSPPNIILIASIARRVTCPHRPAPTSRIRKSPTIAYRGVRSSLLNCCRTQMKKVLSSPRLVPFPETKTEPDPRDLALAWDSIVESGMTVAEPQARELLIKAVKQSPDDPALLSALAYC